MKNVKILVLDVDGTLTDGKIYMGPDGEVCKAFDIKDGYGLHDILPKGGILPVIITGRKSKILENRCRELEITYLFQGISNKLEKLDEVLAQISECCSQSLSYQDVCYCGDDKNDLSCMLAIKEAGGLVSCPKDAVKEVIEIADFISGKPGGGGAVREVIDWITD